MDTYLMMLYVSLEQEIALKQFFIQNGWHYCRPDLSILTDNVGPHVEQVPHFGEKFTEADYTPSKARKPKVTKAKKRKAEQIKQHNNDPEPELENTGELNDNDTYEEVHSDTDEFIPEIKVEVTSDVENNEYVNNEFIPEIKVEVTSDVENNEYVNNVNNDIDYNPAELDDSINHVDNADKDTDYNQENGVIVEMAGNVTGVNMPEPNDTPLSLSEKKRKNIKKTTPIISMEESERNTSNTELFTIDKRKKKKRNYDTAKIGLAYKAVNEDGMSVHKAAKVFGIPESTLRDRHLHLQPVDTLPRAGPNPLFSKEEEKTMVDHLTYMSNIGYIYPRNTFLDMAFEYAIILGKKSYSDPTFKGSWMEGFKKRWPDIYLTNPAILALEKAKATSQEKTLSKHFENLTDTCQRLDLQEHPERIWNIDEFNILMEGTTPQTVTSHVDKNVTLIGCANAAGECIPPYYIFPGKRWSDDWMHNTCPGAAGEMSETGLSNSLTFQNFLKKHFLKCVDISEGQTHLVIFDGDKSHVSLTLSNWGKEHGVEFNILPPNTSRVTQPLDVACFRCLMSIYSTECQTYMRENPGHTITRYVVGELLSKAYLKVFAPSYIKNAFRATGIFPLNSEQKTCH